MQRKTILLVEDEEDIASLIKLHAEMAGYDLLIESDGLQGALAIEQKCPDLVLLDIMLPGQNGLDICRKMKNNIKTRSIPIIMLTAKGEEVDIILGLELGADDYITKPFSPKVLISRIGAVLRRYDGKTIQSDIISFGPYSLNLQRYEFRKHDQIINLTPSEFNILKKLANNPEKVLTRNQLLDEIQDEDAIVIDRNIDVHIASLRKKIGPDFNWIETVRGIGYRFKS